MRSCFPFLFFCILLALAVSCRTPKTTTAPQAKTVSPKAEEKPSAEKRQHTAKRTDNNKPVRTPKEEKKEEKREEVNKLSLSEIAEFSAKLGIQLDGSENPDLIKNAIYWLGTPYRFSGSDKRGTDCSGLAKNIYQEVYGIDLLRSSHDIFTQTAAVKRPNLKEGDLLFFKINKNRISHVGIYLKNDYFIHSSTQKGVIISHLDEDYYKKHFYSGGRFVKHH